jgi:hypothetical protein
LVPKLRFGTHLIAKLGFATQRSLGHNGVSKYNLETRKIIVERKLPDDPLEFIRRCARQGKVLWTYHVNMRLKGRFINRQAILDSYESYEIIEEYPKDKYLPSYLVYSEYQGDIFHILFAVDLEGVNVRIVTAYCPSREEWDEGFKTRRASL